ncbi:MAG TPA: alpha/beta fold hydrolase, partial [Pseudomonadales bacterium]|nr:alpha/beta fold hydrolase [Pseudomonadales bacterium]
MSLTLYHDVFRSESAHPQALVVLHGWGLNAVVWDDIMPALLKHFEVTVIELPGFGRSPMPSGDYTLDYLVEHVLKVAPERAVWLGWSLGGVVATQIAAQFPMRVEALVTVATNACFVANE